MNIESIREIAGHEDERTTLHSYIFDRSTKSDIEKYLDDLKTKKTREDSTLLSYYSISKN